MSEQTVKKESNLTEDDKRNLYHDIIESDKSHVYIFKPNFSTNNQKK